MAIHAECNQCSKQYRVKDHFAGQLLLCKACGAKFRVPARGPGVFDDADIFDIAGRFDDDKDDFGHSETRGQRRAAGARPIRRRPPRKRESNSGAWIVGIGVVAGIAVMAGLFIAGWGLLQGRFNGGGVEQVATPTDPDELFAISSVPVPNFPDLGQPLRRLPGGEALHFVELDSVSQETSGSGTSMKMRVYLPVGKHQPKSIGCVLVAPAGTNLMVGNDMDADDYHDETLPYAQAGMAVVFYSIDGGVDDLETASDSEFLTAYQKFRAACAGVVNGRNALEFVLAKMPQVDPNRIYCAGHSSAATLSLLLAQHEPRVKACIAYAPGTDVEKRLQEILDDPEFVEFLPGLRDFLHQSSPKTHAARFKCPLFLFHALNDSNIPFSETLIFANSLRQFPGNVTFEKVPRGDHYDSMVDEGIPRAIAWLKRLSGESDSESPDGTPNIASKTENLPTGIPGTPKMPSFQPPPGFRNVPSPPGYTPPVGGLPSPPTIPSGGPLGDAVVVFQVLSYDGSGDQAAAARRALLRVPWARPGTVTYDSEAQEIVVGVRGRAVSTAAAKFALQRAGFKIGLTRYMGSGRK